MNLLSVWNHPISRWSVPRINSLSKQPINTVLCCFIAEESLTNLYWYSLIDVFAINLLTNVTNPSLGIEKTQIIMNTVMLSWWMYKTLFVINVSLLHATVTTLIIYSLHSRIFSMAIQTI